MCLLVACAHLGPGTDSAPAAKKSKLAAAEPSAPASADTDDENPKKQRRWIQESDFAATPVTDADLAATPQLAEQQPAVAAQGEAAPAEATAVPPADSRTATDNAPAADSEGQVTADVTGQGAMVGYDKTLDSEKIRKAWAARGGNIGGYEATIGATLMSYSKSGVETTGKGIAFGLRLQETAFDAPSYERQDTCWTATRFGIGLDGSKMTVTSSGYGQSFNMSQTSMTLTAFLGLSLALGSFSSPQDWSGVMIGVDWAPGVTLVKTPETTVAGHTIPSSTSRSTNLKGISVNIESGSLQALAESMTSEAHLKVRLFFLPPVGDLPQMVTVSVGIVDY